MTGSIFHHHLFRLLRLTLAALLLCGSLLSTGPVSLVLAATTVIRPSALNGWAFTSETPVGTGDFVSGPATAPLGTGSAHLNMPGNGSALIGAQVFLGQRLDQITRLEYSTYRASSGIATVTIALQLQPDYDLTDANVAYQGRLVFEPYYTGIALTTSSWQTWNALTGAGWWATAAPGNSVCTQGSPCTWAQVLANFPNIGIHTTLGAVLLKAGSGWTNFDGNVDALTIGVSGTDTTFDFEPETVCTTICYVDAATGNDTYGGDSSASAKLTIQAALNQVSPGGTVIVAPGTYNESPNITKSLTLQSTGGRAATFIALQSGPTYLGSLTIAGAIVTVDGFTLTGFDAANPSLASTNIYITPTADTVSLLNNRIRVGAIDAGTNGDDGFGIVTTYSETPVLDTLTVTGNIFEPVNATGTRAFYINPGTTNFTFTQNQITGNFTRTAITQASNGSVDGNTITGVGAPGSRSAGLGTWGYPDPTVWGQTTFSNNTFSGVGNAISIFESENVMVENNFFSDVDRAIRITTSVPLAFDPLTITVNQNSFINLDNEGVFIDPSVTIAGNVNAELNWWNNSTGPTHASNATGTGEAVGDSADFTQWLCSGTDTSVAAGFQPDLSANNSCPLPPAPPAPVDTSVPSVANAAPAATPSPMPTSVITIPDTGLLIPITGSRAMPPVFILAALFGGGVVGVLITRLRRKR